MASALKLSALTTIRVCSGPKVCVLIDIEGCATRLSSVTHTFFVAVVFVQLLLDDSTLLLCFAFAC